MQRHSGLPRPPPIRRDTLTDPPPEYSIIEFPPEEEDTLPPNAKEVALNAVQRITAIEEEKVQLRAIANCQAWLRMGENQRVLIDALCVELDPARRR